MANEGGQGCAGLFGYGTAYTTVAFATCDTAGTITEYHVQSAFSTGSDKDLAFSLQTKSGSDYTYISGTQTGINTVGATGAVCIALEAGVDFTPTTQASVGDYPSCYWEASTELQTWGGSGWAATGGSDLTEGEGWEPITTAGGGRLAIGVNITEGGGGGNPWNYYAQI